MDAGRDRLAAAYEGTTYWVHAGPQGRFAIRPGIHSTEADELLAAVGAEAWAFVTACNPRSERLADADNAARMARFEAIVRERGLAHVRGEGVGAGHDWPAEPSLLVLGIDEREAAALARGFGQHAIVVGRRGGAARIVWVDDMPPP